MVYHWDDKKADCYRLYIEERKSMDQVMAYWHGKGFAPSKRAFQNQFRRWAFPDKQYPHPAPKNEAIVDRIRELWQQHCTQREMLSKLQNEGFVISNRKLSRLRLRLELLLRKRTPKYMKSQGANGSSRKSETDKKQTVAVPSNQLACKLTNVANADKVLNGNENAQEDCSSNQDNRPISSEPELALLHTEYTLRKQLRQRQPQIEGDKKTRTRKREPRTRVWAGLPAGVPAEPPRFPSETTLDEAKAYLSLDNNLYRQIRESFLRICNEKAVAKKSFAGPEKWAEIVRLLIRESDHLHKIFLEEQDVLQNDKELFRPKSRRALSLDLICIDVTKRIRTLENRMTISDAKTILGLDPEQARHVRSAFAAKLKADHFTNKLESGGAQWPLLKQTWVNESEPLLKALAQGENDPDHAMRLKAIEILARDVMKRQR